MKFYIHLLLPVMKGGIRWSMLQRRSGMAVAGTHYFTGLDDWVRSHFIPKGFYPLAKDCRYAALLVTQNAKIGTLKWLFRGNVWLGRRRSNVSRTAALVLGRSRCFPMTAKKSSAELCFGFSGGRLSPAAA